MNFEFTLTAHGFDKAAKLEKALKDIGIPYDCKMKQPINGKAQKTKAKIDKLVIGTVLSTIAKQPTWSLEEVGRECGVSRASVERIRAGKHVLQQNPLS